MAARSTSASRSWERRTATGSPRPPATSPPARSAATSKRRRGFECSRSAITRRKVVGAKGKLKGVEQVVIEAYQAGSSLQELADRFSVSIKSIHYLLSKRNVP